MELVATTECQLPENDELCTEKLDPCHYHQLVYICITMSRRLSTFLSSDVITCDR